MEYVTHNFRNALAVLWNRPEWSELALQISEIGRDEVLDVQRGYADSGRRVPAGAQSAVNEVFRRRLSPLGWENEVPLFSREDPNLAGWTMDFVKRGLINKGDSEPGFGLGVEVTFNHAEGIAWTLIRLNLAGESSEVLRASQIDVGVAIYPTREFKQWGRMDDAVGTYDRACLWLDKMRPVLPIPIAVIGLQPGWEATDLFRGTRRGGRS
ncbi:MAG: hypothetical protein O2913_07570 [Chloroflexi bacterium]|nr:hypothetical protein [Chloroflexota bacterium]